MELSAAIERLRAFSNGWRDDDEIDDSSHLTGADVRLVLQHADATAPMVRDLIKTPSPG